jgi:adenylate kinase
MLTLVADSQVASPILRDHKPLAIVLLGPPGSGKGTHAGPLSRHLGLPHISTGDLFREHIREQTDLGIEAQKYINQGNLVPDELVLNMLFTRVGAPDCANGYILDGFPRTIVQAQELDRRLQTQVRLTVLNFNLPDSLIIERVAGRIACRNCARPYHKKFDPPTSDMICDQCMEPLYQRDDDREEIILKRLDVYRAQTEPLIAYYAKQSGVLREIDSQKQKSEVFQEVIGAFLLQSV